ncbi:Uncharacterised protein [uncultured archaeon]|nr:Uncharacterised protein [uncultured archaeon]
MLHKFMKDIDERRALLMKVHYNYTELRAKNRNDELLGLCDYDAPSGRLSINRTVNELIKRFSPEKRELNDALRNYNASLEEVIMGDRIILSDNLVFSKEELKALSEELPF